MTRSPTRMIWEGFRHYLTDTIVLPRNYMAAHQHLFNAAHLWNADVDWKRLYHATVCTLGIYHGITGVSGGVFSYIRMTAWYRANILPVTPATRLHCARFLLVARQLSATRLPVASIIAIAYRAFKQMHGHRAEDYDTGFSSFTHIEAETLWHSILNGDRVWLTEFIAAAPSINDCFTTGPWRPEMP